MLLRILKFWQFWVGKEKSNKSWQAQVEWMALDDVDLNVFDDQPHSKQRHVQNDEKPF